jgi:predicted AlkP superfamily pyrophosphatase or phosphodiesterase
MRTPFLVLTLLVWATTTTLDAQSVPRLLVVLVVDQMRASYLQTFGRQWQSGFRTLLDEGLVFENARYPYYQTWTCAGHATISTGTLPRTHGLIANAWFDRGTERSVACTADPDVTDIRYKTGPVDERDDDGETPAPPPSSNGPRFLMVPTLADQLRAQRPGTRIVSLSLKARSAISLAGHGGDVVMWYNETNGGFTTSTAFAEAPRADVERFISDNPVERDRERSWTPLGAPESYVNRDAGVGERPPTGWTGRFPHVPRGREGVDGQFYRLWEYTPFADEYFGEMAEWFVDALALGQRDATDWLSISFSVLDNVGHAFGPDSREVEDVLRRLDVTIGRLIAHLDGKVGRANYVLALSSDHGIPPIAKAPRGDRIASEDIRDRIDETLSALFGPLEKGSYVAYASSGQIVFAPGIYDRMMRTEGARLAVERAVSAIPGVARVLRRDQLSVSSPDALVKAVALGQVDGRSGDLTVVPEPFWYFSARTPTNATTHGSHYDYDQHVPIVFFGGGIGARRDKSAVTPADIAPSLAARVGAHLPGAEGRNIVR